MISILNSSKLELVHFRAIPLLLLIDLVLIVSSCETKKPIETNEDSYYKPLVDTILNHSNHNFVLVEKEDANFYYEPDSFFNKNVEVLIEDALTARDKCVALLGNIRPAYSMKIIYFNDREKIRPYLNMAPKGIALPDAYTLLITTNDSIRAYHTHELMHIISINQFGGYAAQPFDWIQEGIAVYADNPCMNFPIHAISAYLLYANKLPSMDSLFYEFRNLPDMTAYMMAGSVSQYIIETYGLDKFKQVWKQGAENYRK